MEVDLEVALVVGLMVVGGLEMEALVVGLMVLVDHYNNPKEQYPRSHLREILWVLQHPRSLLRSLSMFHSHPLGWVAVESGAVEEADVLVAALVVGLMVGGGLEMEGPVEVDLEVEGSLAVVAVGAVSVEVARAVALRQLR